ncbi:hypothetical protein ACS0TY_011606 [Phlomoides rotata]
MSILIDERMELVGSPPVLINAEHPSFFPMFRAGPTPPNILASATAALRCRLRFGFLLRSSLESVSLLSEVPCLKDTCHERALRFADFNCFRWSLAFSATPRMSLNFFSGNETGSGSENSGGRPRTWTNNLICANVLVYAAQYVSKGKITNWGAKINCGIRKGQLWRLVTCAFLHANIGHLLLNCYSLDSVGPTIEKIWGPERYLTIYISSAIAGSTMSYLLNKSHSVGASGAICGLVGSYFAYLLRNRDTIQGTDEHLKHIGIVIIINMVFGLMYPGIDNWAHLGGFIGGAATNFVVDPTWKLKPIVGDVIREVRKLIDVDRER